MTSSPEPRPGAGSTTGTVPGCGSSGGGGDRDNDREDPGRVGGVDNDRDGDIDKSLTDAIPEEKRNGDVITKRGDELTPDDFRDDGIDNEGGGSGSGGCFLTTAVTSLRGEADEGPTLTVLREFRDGWLAETEEGRALIADYYVLAPGIVSAIPENHDDWSWIAGQVDAARGAILAGLNVEALEIYGAMIHRLEDRWLPSGH